ncbi:uncharacterized protein MONBRDRAFT_24891 [Monosiga brevicollis MX1]|uniref:SKI-interacting protein SKIP SNW domain-containing protein n=1 Tax=Monosiga brevicollis TaxID=81824 RepID=A9UY20_MONBE|nr:uncharacterized protein MONBRDRAFT_24891 [Monosiga brevicollis MX1]EDQ89785.1 predicted protein [Monosiga brevicollis MX1]|eukprot:XP_001745207.1 hypothetical protein [Monosiga brevicollis MX1]
MASLLPECIFSGAEQTVASRIPAYGKRKGYLPRKPEDFGDGGAFPELHFAQYPLGMGLKDKQGNSKAVVPVQVDQNGKIRYDALLRHGQRSDKIVHSTYDSLAAVDVTNDEERRQMPSEDTVEETTLKTKQALEELVNGKIQNVRTTHVDKVNRDATYIRYTPGQIDQQHNSGAQQRIIRMVDVQVDPMQPPKFRTNKKIPRGPPSPPAPVLHSPPRKVTADEQRNMRIPPCISNWKNSKGFVVPLDKRMAADGRALQDVTINDKFAKLSEALHIAERKSREDIAMRQDIQKRAAQKEKERKEEVLANMARRAREERAGIRHELEDEDEEDLEQVEAREQIRRERERERRRQMNIANAAPDKRNRLNRDKERDVSERIALGLPAPSAAQQSGGYDTRLFGQSQGMDAGFGADDGYNVYDKPFRGEQAQSIYKPSKVDNVSAEDEYEAIKTTDRFRADKGFSGTESGSKRGAAPVQFEKSNDDLFGLNSFLEEAKDGKRGASG